MNEKNYYDLIKEMSEATSETGGTSLPTLLIPGNTQLSLISSQLVNELSTSQNIIHDATCYGIVSLFRSYC